MDFFERGMSTGREGVLFNLLDHVGTKIYRFKLSQNKFSLGGLGKLVIKALWFPGSPPKGEASRELSALETDQLPSKEGSHSIQHQSAALFQEISSNPSVHSQALEITWDV